MSDDNVKNEQQVEVTDDLAEVTPEERICQLEEALAAKELEASANWDRLLRERADLENFKSVLRGRRKSCSTMVSSL